MKTLTIAPSENGGGLLSQKEAMKAIPYYSSNHSAAQSDDMASYWTEESFFDASLISGCAIEESIAGEDENDDNNNGTHETALNEGSSSHAEFEEETLEEHSSYEEPTKFGSPAITRSKTKKRITNHIQLRRTTSTDTADMSNCHNSGLTTEGDVSLMIVEGTDDEYEERTVEEFIGSSDYMELEITETEEDVTESETPEDDDINDDDDGQSTAFSLTLPAPSAHGQRNYDSVSTISFAFDDLGNSSRSELTENTELFYVTVGGDCGASVITRDSGVSAQTPTSSSMMTDDIQSIKPQGGLSFSIHTHHSMSLGSQATTASTIISNAPTTIMGNLVIAPSPSSTKELEKSNTIISNITRNININRKKDGKRMDLSRTYLAPLKGRERNALIRSNSWGTLNQRRRERRGAKKNAPTRRKSSDDVDFEVSGNGNQSSQTRPILSQRGLQAGQSQKVDVLDGSDRSIISLSQSAQSGNSLEGSDRSIISHTMSQRINHLGVSPQEALDQSINSQGVSRSGSSGKLSRSGSSSGLSRSRSSNGLSRSGSAGRLSRSGSGNRSRSGSAGRMPRSGSGNRLDRMSNAANPPRRMLTRGGSGKFLRDDAANRAASGNSDGRRMVVMERAHLVQMAVGSSNRRMMARANSAKKLVLDDQRQTGSHSRTGIFKIEESKDLRFAKSKH